MESADLLSLLEQSLEIVCLSSGTNLAMVKQDWRSTPFTLIGQSVEGPLWVEPEGEKGALVPEGGGIIVLGADDVEIYNNTIRDNRTGGVGIFSTATAFKPEQIDLSPNPERVRLYGNTFKNNGYQPAKELTDMGISGADIIWDVSNWDQKFDDTNATSFPPVLPSSRWPDIARRAYWQALNFVITKLM